MKMKLFVVTLAVLATFANAKLDEFHYEHVVGGISGSTVTTRYWDCCKPTCSWQGNIHFNSKPVQSCAANGATVLSDDNIQSGCVGGDAYICNNYVGTIQSNDLAYGYAASAFIDAPDPEKCCACFELTFLKNDYNKQVGGKKLVVQVINTGTAKNVNTFDLHMPGGGVGYYNEGCKKQWNAPEYGWGDRYGGVHNSTECYQLPQQLQAGCLFRFNFFGDVSNPPATFVEVTCPSVLTKASGCIYAGK